MCRKITVHVNRNRMKGLACADPGAELIILLGNRITDKKKLKVLILSIHFKSQNSRQLRLSSAWLRWIEIILSLYYGVGWGGGGGGHNPIFSS